MKREREGGGRKGGRERGRERSLMMPLGPTNILGWIHKKTVGRIDQQGRQRKAGTWRRMKRKAQEASRQDLYSKLLCTSKHSQLSSKHTTFRRMDVNSSIAVFITGHILAGLRTSRPVCVRCLRRFTSLQALSRPRQDGRRRGSVLITCRLRRRAGCTRRVARRREAFDSKNLAWRRFLCRWQVANGWF